MIDYKGKMTQETQEHLYAKTLGFFEPSLFHIHLAYDVKLDDWKNWPDEALFTYFHEYIHFLQDLTTTSGLYNIFVLDEYLKYAVNYIYGLPKGTFKVPIPVVKLGNNVFNNRTVATGFDPNTGTIWMTRVYDVPKGTGIFLIGDEGNYSIPTTTSSSYYRNMLVGTLENTDIPSSTDAYTNYYLTVEDDDLKFCKVAGNGRTMSANHAYLQIPNEIGNRPASASIVSETITISELGKSTYCSENGLDFSGINGLKAYTATGYTHHSGTIWMTRVKDVPAGTGIFLLGNPGSYDVPTTTHDEQHLYQSYYENMLVGLVESTYIPSSTEDQTNYYLTTENGELKFCRIAGEGRTMSSHRAYLQIPSSILNGGSRELKSASSEDNGIGCCDEVIGVKLEGYGNSTGIKEIVNSQDTNGDTYYNLNGQKMNRLGKVLFIIIRKKMIYR